MRNVIDDIRFKDFICRDIKSREFNGEDQQVIDFLEGGIIRSGDLVYRVSSVSIEKYVNETEDSFISLTENSFEYFSTVESAMEYANGDEIEYCDFCEIAVFQANVVSGYLFLEHKGVIKLIGKEISQETVDKDIVNSYREREKHSMYSKYFRIVDYTDLLLDIHKEKKNPDYNKLLPFSLKLKLGEIDTEDWESLFKLWDLYVDENIQSPIHRDLLKFNSFVEFLRINRRDLNDEY